MEGLRLDRVEVGEARVERRVLPEGGDGQRLQVEQLRVRRVLLRQDEVAEGDGQRRLRAAAVGLLASGSLLSPFAQPAFAENELAALAGGQFKSELVDTQCFATSCKLQTEACVGNADCTKGLACTAKCMGDAECTVGCFAKYGNKQLDEMLEAMAHVMAANYDGLYADDSDEDA